MTSFPDSPRERYGIAVETTHDNTVIQSVRVSITLDGQVIGQFAPDYSQPCRPKLAVTNVGGRDFGIIAPQYFKIGIISLPDCTLTFETVPEIWHEDFVPLGFWTDDRIPGLVYVAAMEWGDPEHKAMGFYFWVDRNGKMVGRPICVGEFSSWPNEGSMDHLFEFENVEFYEGEFHDGELDESEWGGWFTVKTNTRRPLADVYAERKERIGIDPPVPARSGEDTITD